VVYDQLVKEGKLSPAKLSRSTFYRYLANRPDLKNLSGEGTGHTQRFSYEFINELWQADVMYGPRIRDGRKKRDTYLICFLDDASRLIPYSGFAFAMDFLTLRQFLKEAVQRRGKPKMLYTDNAKIYPYPATSLALRWIWLLSSARPALPCCRERQTGKILWNSEDPFFKHHRTPRLALMN